MSNHSAVPIQFNELMDILKDDIEISDALYQLKANSDEELNSIYKGIKTKLLQSKKCLPQSIIKSISIISTYNNRSMKSYLKLAKQIYDDYHPASIIGIQIIFDYLFFKE
ncbi:hypothetical protein TVAG_177490 [Trichomonas vaginalis G3]|uniref:Uncharacterized protein n=1 Tax=Trichomonas vaginalis (strain ATCC PRA-98 / G3) TaxID=412133 RepID=A2FMP1_TRIV3|nr:protein of unknown function (DUF3447) [Trichomonas vaginalis G3]EAX93841.1 hypothetical protein TVAG_177490 [Trichomonas vaginalis G3]KAI5490915.1 protein of unknown function (DUF3447) [Trichomonas vaginalis G3]|eukprot:XP_001306771.1 hypothetical protein [Trichomonas vaginalis G3]